MNKQSIATRKAPDASEVEINWDYSSGDITISGQSYVCTQNGGVYRLRGANDYEVSFRAPTQWDAIIRILKELRQHHKNNGLYAD
jgi:hypothetical protein